MLKNLWRKLLISFCTLAGLCSIFASEESISTMDEEYSPVKKKYVSKRRAEDDPYDEKKKILFARQKEEIQSLSKPSVENSFPVEKILKPTNIVTLEQETRERRKEKRGITPSFWLFKAYSSSRKKEW